MTVRYIDPYSGEYVDPNSSDAPPPFEIMHHVGPAPAPPANLPVITPGPGRHWHVGPGVGYQPYAGLAGSRGWKAVTYFGISSLIALAAQVAAAYYGYKWGRERGIGVGVGIAGFLLGAWPVGIVSTIAAPFVLGSGDDGTTVPVIDADFTTL